MFRMTVLTCLWKRREVAKIMLDNLVRIRDELSDFIVLDVLAVGSEGAESRDLAHDHGAMYLDYENQPLGAKWNAGLRACVKNEPDAVMILGSDNIVNTRLVEEWAYQIRHGHDYLGFLDGYMIQSGSNQMVHWNGYSGFRQGEPLGSGRCYSRQLLDKAGWVLWDSSLARGLDWSVTQRLRSMRGITASAWMMNVHGIRHLGIKTPENICSFQSLLRNSSHRIEAEDPEQLLDWFGEEIGSRILHLKVPVLDFGKPKPEPKPEPKVYQPQPGAPVGKSDAEILEQLRDELKDKLPCPRCFALTATNRVVFAGMKEGEQFICDLCATKDQVAKEASRKASLPTPSNFLPQVSGDDEAKSAGSIGTFKPGE